VPKHNIKQVDGSPLDFHMGILRRYVSSKGTYKEFCGVCGAFVYWHSDADEGKPEDLIDISVGLFEAETGALAEEWLDWHVKEMIFLQLAQNKPLLENLAAGVKEWGVEKKHVVSKHRLGGSSMVHVDLAYLQFTLQTFKRGAVRYGSGVLYVILIPS